MKGFTISIVLLFAYQICYAQVQSSNASVMNLQPLTTTLEVEAFGRTLWELAYKHRDAEYQPVPAKEVISDIDAWLSKSGKDTLKWKIAEEELVSINKQTLVNLFSRLQLIGSQLGEFLYSKNSSIPVRFTRKDSNMVFLLTGVACANTYNTLRATAKERASKIITSMVLPTLKDFSETLKGVGAKYYGMFVLYGSKDFSNSSTLSEQAESVALIVSSESCDRFVNGELTEDELVESADVYQSDRDMIGGIKKIKITIQ